MKNKTKTTRTTETKRMIALAVMFLFLVVLATLVVTPWLDRLMEPDMQAKVKKWVDSLGVIGWIAMLGIQILQIIIAFIPGEPVEILSGVFYGTWGGLILCMIGSVIASAAVFALTRKFGLPLIYRLFSKEKVESYEFLRSSQKIETAAFILFLLPGTPKDMLTYIAGISKIKMSRFLLITTFARIPSIITGTIAGDTLLSNWKLALAIFLLTGAVGLIGIHYRGRIEKYLHRISRKK